MQTERKTMNFANTLGSATPMPRHLWAVLLAGGDGIRLRDLTVEDRGRRSPEAVLPDHRRGEPLESDARSSRSTLFR